jgi:hypothetical protein
MAGSDTAIEFNTFVGKKLVSWHDSWHHHNIFSVSRLVFIVCMLLNSVMSVYIRVTIHHIPVYTSFTLHFCMSFLVYSPSDCLFNTLIETCMTHMVYCY